MPHSDSNENFVIDILIVAYRRVENLRSILNLCLATSANRIYIAVDGCRPSESTCAQNECRDTQKVALQAKNEFPARIEVFLHEENVGSSVNMLSALDTVFKSSENLIILEDDCIPTNIFFDYVKAGLELLKDNSDIWAVSGSQHNSNIEKDGWYLSSYFQVWGWATSRDRWKAMKSSVFGLSAQNSFDSSTQLNISRAEKAYWLAGSRRALDGFVDAWDTPITAHMRLNGKYTLVPTKNLISNVGNDQAALHIKNSKWTQEADQNYSLPSSPPIPNLVLDEWTRSIFYHIRFRHFFSTRLRQLIDSFRNPPIRPIIERLRSENFY